MNIQTYIDDLSARWQRERAETQMTLGRLIAVLKAMPPNTQVANLIGLGSYRGYYSDLYFDQEHGTRPAGELLADCEAAMGREFTGYKGGEFLMGENTPLWVASYGCCGEQLMAVHAGGEIETAEDD